MSYRIHFVMSSTSIFIVQSFFNIFSLNSWTLALNFLKDAVITLQIIEVGISFAELPGIVFGCINMDQGHTFFC